MSIVDEVKARLSILDLVSEYVSFENTSTRSPKARCPFHEERTPSFTVSPEKGTWRCWGACSDGGDVFKFVMRVEEVDFSTALDMLCEKAGIERRYDREKSNAPSKTVASAIHSVNDIAEKFFADQLQGTQGREALEYLQSRAIDLKTALRRGIGFAPSGISSLLDHLRAVGADRNAVAAAGLLVRRDDGSWGDMFTNRITISIRDRNGRLIGFGARAMGAAQPKYLNTRATTVFDKSTALYGIDWAADAIRTTGRAVIVEGYMDVITAHEHGFRNTVATMGAALTKQQLRILDLALSNNVQSRLIVLCLDNDAAGLNATMRGLHTAMSEFRSSPDSASRAGASTPPEIRIARPIVSEHGRNKDPDEAIRQDAAQWLQSVEDAVEMMQFFIDGLASQHNLSIESGKDAAIDQIEPYFSAIPPSTVTARRHMETLAERLGFDYSALVNMMSVKRTARNTTVQRRRGQPNRGISHRIRSHGRDANYSNAVMRRVGVTSKAPWERELMACLMQYDFAIDHAVPLQPEHFQNEDLGRLFKHILGNRDPNGGLAEGSRLWELAEELKQMQLCPMSAENNFMDQDQADVISITSKCVQRTRGEYLRREKMKEAAEAESNGNLLPPAKIKSAVDKNEQIRQLTSVQTSM